MTDRYAVFGNPVAHSLSPEIHAAFARQTHRDISYERQLVEPGEFEKAARRFFDGGGKGLNITTPFKIDAYNFATRLTERGRRAGAVNTLALGEDRTILGDNTDGAGMVRDILVNQGWPMEGRDVLLLGAGGAVRGVLEPLLAQSPRSVTIANRTESKAEQLAAAFARRGNVSGCGFAALEGRQFDLVINGTSASLSGDLPPLPDGLMAANGCCYDMMYSAKPTVFLDWARQAGVAHFADGLGMLVEQAAESFYLWQKVRPETGDVIAGLRRRLS